MKNIMKMKTIFLENFINQNIKIKSNTKSSCSKSNMKDNLPLKTENIFNIVNGLED